MKEPPVKIRPGRNYDTPFYRERRRLEKLKASYTKTSESLKVKAINEKNITFAICWACLLFYREKFLKEKGAHYKLEDIANDIVQMFEGSEYTASPDLVALVAKVNKPTTIRAEFDQLFESGDYKIIEHKFGNPLKKDSNARRGHLYDSLKAVNGTHLFAHDLVSLLEVNFTALELKMKP